MRERPLQLASVAMFLLTLLGCPAAPPESPQPGATKPGTNPNGQAPASLPQRIVSLAPNVTETLFALGCHERLVGVTRHCTYPDEAKQIPRVGDYVNPSLELVLTREPDLVVTPSEGTILPLVRKLQDLGIAVHVFDASSYQATIDAITSLGRRVGADQSAQQLTQNLVAARQMARDAALREQRRCHALFVLDRAPLVLAGSGSLADDLLQICSLDNAAANLGRTYPRPATETLLMLKADIIFDASMVSAPDSDAVALLWWQRVAPTHPAVRNTRIVTLDPDLVNRAGPRLAQGLSAISTALQPAAGSTR